TRDKHPAPTRRSRTLPSSAQPRRKRRMQLLSSPPPCREGLGGVAQRKEGAGGTPVALTPKPRWTFSFLPLDPRHTPGKLGWRHPQFLSLGSVSSMTRRELSPRPAVAAPAALPWFLSSARGAQPAVAPMPAAKGDALKITDVKTFLTAPANIRLV